MTSVTITIDNETELLLMQQAQAMCRDLVAVGDQAPDGQVLRQLETFLLTRGRDFLRRAMETAAQAQAPAAEKKGFPPGAVPAAAAETIKERRRIVC